MMSSMTPGPFGSASESQTWRRYDHPRKPSTAPPRGELVWVYEEYDLGVTVGFFNGSCMSLWTGDETFSFTHWMPMRAPEAPDDPWP
jgi:hypothetical protein